MVPISGSDERRLVRIVLQAAVLLPEELFGNDAEAIVRLTDLAGGNERVLRKALDQHLESASGYQGLYGGTAKTPEDNYEFDTAVRWLEAAITGQPGNQPSPERNELFIDQHSSHRAIDVAYELAADPLLNEDEVVQQLREGFTRRALLIAAWLLASNETEQARHVALVLTKAGGEPDASHHPA